MSIIIPATCFQKYYTNQQNLKKRQAFSWLTMQKIVATIQIQYSNKFTYTLMTADAGISKNETGNRKLIASSMKSFVYFLYKDHLGVDLLH